MEGIDLAKCSCALCIQTFTQQLAIQQQYAALDHTPTPQYVSNPSVGTFDNMQSALPSNIHHYTPEQAFIPEYTGPVRRFPYGMEPSTPSVRTVPLPPPSGRPIEPTHQSIACASTPGIPDGSVPASHIMPHESFSYGRGGPSASASDAVIDTSRSTLERSQNLDQFAPRRANVAQGLGSPVQVRRNLPNVALPEDLMPEPFEWLPNFPVHGDPIYNASTDAYFRRLAAEDNMFRTTFLQSPTSPLSEQEASRFLSRSAAMNGVEVGEQGPPVGPSTGESSDMVAENNTEFPGFNIATDNVLHEHEYPDQAE